MEEVKEYDPTLDFFVAQFKKYKVVDINGERKYQANYFLELQEAEIFCNKEDNLQKTFASLDANEKELLRKTLSVFYQITTFYNLFFEKNNAEKMLLELVLQEDFTFKEKYTVKNWYERYVNQRLCFLEYVNEQDDNWIFINTLYSQNKIFKAIPRSELCVVTFTVRRYIKFYEELKFKINRLEKYIVSTVWLGKNGYEERSVLQTEETANLIARIKHIKNIIELNCEKLIDSEEYFLYMRDALEKLYLEIITCVELCFKHFKQMPFFKDYALNKDDEFSSFYNCFYEDIQNRLMIYARPLDAEIIKNKIMKKVFKENTDFVDVVCLCGNNFRNLLNMLDKEVHEKIIFPDDSLNPLTKEVMIITQAIKKELSKVGVDIWCNKLPKKISNFFNTQSQMIDNSMLAVLKSRTEKYNLIFKWFKNNNDYFKFFSYRNRDVFSDFMTGIRDIDYTNVTIPFLCSHGMLLFIYNIVWRSPQLSDHCGTILINVGDEIELLKNDKKFDDYSCDAIEQNILIPLISVVKICIFSSLPQALVKDKVPVSVKEVENSFIKQGSLVNVVDTVSKHCFEKLIFLYKELRFAKEIEYIQNKIVYLNKKMYQIDFVKWQEDIKKEYQCYLDAQKEHEILLMLEKRETDLYTKWAKENYLIRIPFMAFKANVTALKNCTVAISKIKSSLSNQKQNIMYSIKNV